jgi:UDP-N-acetylglucosamine 2-epimerase (non-hydrolysing)
MPLNLLLVAGARPNFMKVAPLIRAIERHNTGMNGSKGGSPVFAVDAPTVSSSSSVKIRFNLVHTGQHYDAQMSQIFFDELGIPAPDVNLEVGSGSHASQTAEIMKGFEPICQREKPDWVVVVGDVNSTLACTLVASKMGVRVAHVEAGLRSFDRTMPEEINRIVTDLLADLLLTPSIDANENLRREGIPESRIRLVGNIMIDSLIAHFRNGHQNGRLLERLNLKEHGFVYVTLHRPSNVDCRKTLAKIVEELSRLADQWPVVFPIHPRTRKRMEEFDLSFLPKAGMKLLDPIGYDDSITLTKHARCVLTDSGGLQEESTFFRTPCLTLRPNTERPITITIGSNRLTSVEQLRSDFERALRSGERLGQTPPLWDGKAAERILHSLL